MFMLTGWSLLDCNVCILNEEFTGNECTASQLMQSVNLNDGSPAA